MQLFSMTSEMLLRIADLTLTLSIIDKKKNNEMQTTWGKEKIFYLLRYKARLPHEFNHLPLKNLKI